MSVNHEMVMPPVDPNSSQFYSGQIRDARMPLVLAHRTHRAMWAESVGGDCSVRGIRAAEPIGLKIQYGGIGGTVRGGCQFLPLGNTEWACAAEQSEGLVIVK